MRVAVIAHINGSASALDAPLITPDCPRHEPELRHLGLTG
jgi:hypothetical protein